MHLARFLTAIGLAANTAALSYIEEEESVAVDGSAANCLNDTMDHTIGKRGSFADDEDTCPKDYPDECWCFGSGVLFCGAPDTGDMADYKMDCEATHHVRDIIYTLCSKDPEHPVDEFFTWKGTLVIPGQTIYKCWPMKIGGTHSQ